MAHKKEHQDTHAYILEQAVFLFAKKGYNGVSMRDLSKAVGLSAAALYYHFTDKETLYLEVMKYAFKDKAAAIVQALNIQDSPQKRLEIFLERFIHLISADPDFRALVQWELLDNDETRLKIMAERIFLEPFQGVIKLAKELAPKVDPHMLTVSIIGLVMFHFETASIRRFLPGWQPEQTDPEILSGHLTQLLIGSLAISPDNLSSDTLRIE